MEYNFLTPVDKGVLDFVSSLSSQELGSKIVFHTENQFPDISRINIAIIGVLENRRSTNPDHKVNLTAVRKKLYAMFPGNWDASIADFGDIIAGDAVEDTYFALKRVVSNLIKNKVIPIIIGGSQDLTYPLYRAYDDLEQMVNLVAVDNKFDFGKENEKTSANSYLTKIIIDEPNNLFNYCNISDLL
jgi:arginase family enzyme